MTLTGKMRHFLLLAILVTVATLPAATRAANADAGLVLEAIQVLDEEYVDQALVERVRLLNVALDGIKASLSAAGVPAKFAPLASGTAPVEADRIFRAAFDPALTAAAGKVSPRELAYGAIIAITNSLNDSHTGFLTPEQYRERIARQRQQAVLPRSPAERLGVRPFDRIVRVNDTPTGGMTSEQVVSMIRGPARTAVTVTFERVGRSGPFALTITRAPIVVPPIFAARMVGPGIGHIYLYEFTQGSARELRGAIQQLLGQGMRALVLDLRGDTGGFLHELRDVMNLLLPRGVPVYQLVTSRGTEVVRTERNPSLPASMPLVVLGNEGTASASELRAAAPVAHH